MIRDLYDNSIVAYKTETSQIVNLVLDTIRLAMHKEKKVAKELQLHYFYNHERIQLKSGVTPLMLRHSA